jgi:hypothetical protein
MSSKVSQLSPRASTRVVRNKVSVQNSRVNRSANALDISLEAGFLQSWFAYDPDLDAGSTGINWGAISGLALSIAISVSCWAGVVWTVTHVLR